MTRSNIHPSQQRRHCRRSDKLAFLLMALSVYDVEALTLGGRYGFRFNRKSETQMHDSDADADHDVSSLWKMRSNNDNNRRRNNNNSHGAIIGLDEHSPESSIPFGPVLRGGSLADVAIVPLSAAAGSSTAALALEQPPRQKNHPLASTWTNVRSGVQGARRGLVKGVVNLNGVLRGNNRNINNGRQASHVHDGHRRSSSILALDVDVPVHATITGTGNANTSASARANQNNNNGLPSMLRMGGMMIQRRLRRRRDASKAASVGVLEAMTTRMETVDCLDVMGDIDIWTDHETVSTAYDKAALSSRGGPSSSVAVYDDSMSASASVSSSISSSSGAAGNNIMADSDAYYVIETPLFPIILPKAWEPPTIASPTSTSGSVTAVSITSLEISVAVEEDVTSSTTAKPSPQLLQAATQPLLPEDVLDSFTGREFYYPETIEALTTTGMKMTWGQGSNPYINWTGEKKTDKFLKDHHNDDNSSDEWYAALDSSQEVLVWAGKFATTTGGGYGAELPIIKTTSIIHKSPKYLTELLMDSERVKVYNKMSLGRVDEKVFQTGVDTQGGAFGDGETKVVRNLTKPPMVSSLLEFVTCMHARKLRPGDTALLSPNDEQYDSNNVSNVEEEPAVEGYVVVSRAVTGGEWSTDTSSSDSNDNTKRVRNEILLGVNILKAVPGEPNKTELTAVTHVYSPMIPLMLAKNAGVKGAVDFVRDIRALP